MNSVKKIIVLGGRGETGRRIVEALSLRYPYLHVAIGSRRAAAAGGHGTNSPIVQIDIHNHPHARNVLSQYDLAIIALGPMHVHGSKPHQLCIEAGVDCIDINDNLAVADQVLALHDVAVQTKHAVFTGMGFTPGLSSMLLAELASRHASPSGTYRIRACMGAAYGGGETSPYAILSSFRSRIETLVDGSRQHISTPWKDGRERFPFAGQHVAVETIPFSPLEAASLASARSAMRGAVSNLDARYHIQYLKQGFARLLSRFELSPRVVEWFAMKFYTSGQNMKRKKDADPDTVLWVYPDDAPQSGLLVHGVVSSYDLTAAMASAVADAWLAGDLDECHGVFAIDQLKVEQRASLCSHLARRGITSKPSDMRRLADQGLDFGWVASVGSSDVRALRHYHCNWYTASPKHPKMVPLQKRFLLQSEVWKALRRRRNGLPFLGFILLTMRRWRQHYKALAAFRSAATGPDANWWPVITRDISMFTSGYSRVRDLLGQTQALQLYGQMFLETGRMEMRWLWPDPTVFAALDQPAEGVRDYWLAFMESCQELGVLRYQTQTEGEHHICAISYCAYADMFAQLQCPELAGLVRQMEHEALAYMASGSGLEIDWQAGPSGTARILLRLPHSAEMEPAERRQAVSM
ncbi:MAG: saccharopine dehydrogenase NADP-binding domain-containing protein [Gammaproteobacteria bacterium]|nr:saccharopine dehydrogenase NADP-binding domain-containing protein [Gammaproteobacteria bacterium]